MEMAAALGSFSHIKWYAGMGGTRIYVCRYAAAAGKRENILQIFQTSSPKVTQNESKYDVFSLGCSRALNCRRRGNAPGMAAAAAAAATTTT